MSISGEDLLSVVRRAVEASGVSVTTNAVSDRRRLEAETERIANRDQRCVCGWSLDEDDD